MATKRRVKLSIIMPVYNEAATFDECLRRLQAAPMPGIQKEIIIVEAGSTDGTPKIIDKHKKEKNVRVFHLKNHCGKGSKLQFGFKKATGDIITIQDADLEYDPNDHYRLIQPILKGETSFVLGSRHLGKRTWQFRRFHGRDKLYAYVINTGTIFLDGFFNLMYGVRLTDPQTMYKVFKRSCLKNITFKEDGFHMDYEMVIKLIKAGYKPIELPVKFKSRGYSQGKKVTIIKTGTLDVLTILKYRLFN